MEMNNMDELDDFEMPPLSISKVQQNHNKTRSGKLMAKTTGMLRDIMNKSYEVPEERLLKRNGNLRVKTKNNWIIKYEDLNPLLEADPQLREDIMDGVRLAYIMHKYRKLMVRKYGEKVHKIVFKEYEDIENEIKYLIFAIQDGRPKKGRADKAPN
jgi:hypothetical protein